MCAKLPGETGKEHSPCCFSARSLLRRGIYRITALLLAGSGWAGVMVEMTSPGAVAGEGRNLEVQIVNQKPVLETLGSEGRP